MHTILFDGVCNFCDASINFIIDRDPRNTFVFAPLQSDSGRKVLNAYHVDAATQPDSIILIKNGKLFTKSSAALEIARELSGGWPILYAFKIVPAPIRDFLYDLVAKNRYKLMGCRESCRIPAPELQRKFLV